MSNNKITKEEFGKCLEYSYKVNKYLTQPSNDLDIIETKYSLTKSAYNKLKEKAIDIARTTPFCQSHIEYIMRTLFERGWGIKAVVNHTEHIAYGARGLGITIEQAIDLIGGIPNE